MSTHPTDGRARPHPAAAWLLVPHRGRKGAPSARLRRFLSRVMRGRRVSRRRAILSLVIEQILIGGARQASTTSYAENVIRAWARRPVTTCWQDPAHPGPLASRTDGLRAEQAKPAHPGRIPGRTWSHHPDGGVRTVAGTASDQDKQREQIEADIDRGSFRHRRLPTTLRRVPLLVFGADGCCCCTSSPA